MFACHAGLSTSELRLKVKPKPGDREATPADYESIEEEEEEENIIDIEGVCFNFSHFDHYANNVHRNSMIEYNIFCVHFR